MTVREDRADIGATSERIAAHALDRGITLAVAESLTAGNLAAALGAAPDSGTWFAGGVVAYTEEVKRRVLGMPDVPVVSCAAAAAMARGVRELLRADVAVAVTGVGGPGAQDGEPAGSVWFAVTDGDETREWHREFDGDPVRILEQTLWCALTGVEELLADAADRIGS
ncbi:CinA family protein [Nocardia takedensis]